MLPVSLSKNKKVAVIMNEWIKIAIEEKIGLLNSISENGYTDQLERIGYELVKVIKRGNMIFTAGNGGSAADAQHFAGELVGRFMKDRKAMAAMSLCTDPSVVTSIANDYGYDDLFSRELEGLGKRGDTLIVFSTSGNSENLIRAVAKAKEMEIYTIGLLGKDGGAIKSIVDEPLVVPGSATPRIQEMHSFSLHILCEVIEREIIKEQ